MDNSWNIWDIITELYFPDCYHCKKNCNFKAICDFTKTHFSESHELDPFFSKILIRQKYILYRIRKPGAHVQRNICYSICLKHLMRSRAGKNWIFFLLKELMHNMFWVTIWYKHHVKSKSLLIMIFLTFVIIAFSFLMLIYIEPQVKNTVYFNKTKNIMSINH